MSCRIGSAAFGIRFAIQFLLTAFIAGVWTQIPFALEGGLTLVAASYVVTAAIFWRFNFQS